MTPDDGFDDRCPCCHDGNDDDGVIFAYVYKTPVFEPGLDGDPDQELSFQDIVAMRGPQLTEIRQLPETWECPAIEGGVL